MNSASDIMPKMLASDPTKRLTLKRTNSIGGISRSTITDSKEVKRMCQLRLFQIHKLKLVLMNQ